MSAPGRARRDPARRATATTTLAAVVPAAFAVVATLVPATARAQRPDDLELLSDRGLYEAACANCHGVDGRGVERALLGFEEDLPDFTDCDFAVREPDADWVAIAHDGGPVRGFSSMMPAFGGALTTEQLARIVRHIRTFCTDAEWPPGELNLPRALLTEKAYPEDEWVVAVDASLEGPGAVGGSFVYERRFGPRSQIEVVVPFGWREEPLASRWVSGLGDVVVGVKHALHHDGARGRILAVGGEVALPTGDADSGFGAPGAALEGFASYGQILANDAFVQLQAGAETGLYGGGESEVFGRGAVGLALTEGAWGRSWTPMAEVQAARELEGGAATAWDFVPQMQVSLNRRQHVLASAGVMLPLSETARPARFFAYVLLDWFDGGFFEGW